MPLLSKRSGGIRSLVGKGPFPPPARAAPTPPSPLPDRPFERPPGSAVIAACKWPHCEDRQPSRVMLAISPPSPYAGHAPSGPVSGTASSGQLCNRHPKALPRSRWNLAGGSLDVAWRSASGKSVEGGADSADCRILQGDAC